MRRLALLLQGHTRVAARYSPWEELEIANPQPAFSIEQSEDVDSSIAVIKSAARRSSAADYAIDLAVPLLVGVTTNSVGDELNRQSGRHGLRHELSHKEMAAVAVHETHEINRSHSPLAKFTAVLFSSSLWLRREAPCLARCQVQTP